MARFQLAEPPSTSNGPRVIAKWWKEWHEQASPEIRADFARRGIVIPPVETPDPTGWKSPLQYTPSDNRNSTIGKPIPADPVPDPAQEEREQVARAKAQKERDRIHPCGYTNGFQNCGLTICWEKVEPKKD